jgi:hypothetical protein
MNSRNKYFLYRHIRLDKNEVFYIGIGTLHTRNTSREDRIKYSRAFSIKSRNQYWKNIVSKSQYKIEILYVCNTQKEIIRKEKEFIKLYKKTLCNLTDGGFGIQSFKQSIETKKKIGLASKLRKRKHGYKLKYTDEGYIRHMNNMKNRIVSKITREKMSKSMEGNQNGSGHKIQGQHKINLIFALSKPIIQYDLEGKKMKRFNSIGLTCKELNLTRKILHRYLLTDKIYNNSILRYEKI